MAKVTMTTKIKWRWWLKSYLLGVWIASRLTGCEPNWDRVRYWVGKGIKFEVR